MNRVGIFLSTCLISLAASSAIERKPIFLAPRSARKAEEDASSSLATRRIEEDSIHSEIPDVDFTLDIDPNSDASSQVCSTGCEGDYSEITAAMENLWEEEEMEYEFFFLVKGNYAVGAGVIYDNYLDDFEAMLSENPQVHTLILVDVPGSGNDEIALLGSKLVYENKLSTCVPSNGHVASGGTDLFVSGYNRYATKGARIGIHSWAMGDDMIGSDLPKKHPQHDPYEEFFQEVCIPNTFYWDTLSHGLPMHYITEDEINTNFPYMRDCNDMCDYETSQLIGEEFTSTWEPTDMYDDDYSGCASVSAWSAIAPIFATSIFLFLAQF